MIATRWSTPSTASCPGWTLRRRRQRHQGRHRHRRHHPVRVRHTAGRLATLTNPRGKSYRYGYDDAGRIVSSTTPTGRIVRYAYTPNGKPSTITLPSGSVSYAYDAVDRITKIDYSDTTPDLSYTYDVLGRTATAGNGTTVADYDYDDLGRTTRIARGAQVSDYQWDPAGRPTKTTMPGNRSQSYTWNSDSRLTGTTLTTAAGSRTVDYGYDPAGNLTSVTRAGGPTTSYGYDRAGAVTRVAHRAGATTLAEQNVVWGPQGNPATVTTTRGTSTANQLYSYDAAGQVTGVCLAGTGTTCPATAARSNFEYDLNGNRSKTVDAGTTTTYSYDDDDRPTGETVNGTTRALGYDANGLLASRATAAGTVTYSHGLDANLRSVRLADGRTVGYGYDEAGNRTTRTINGAADATWTWDTLGLPTRIEERNGSGTATHQWWADPQTDLGTALADTVAATPSWLLGDFQGSITDTAGPTALTGSATLGPYGEPVTANGTYPANPLRFHGQYLDQLTGLYDMRARDYEPTSGRFTSPDPLPAAMSTPFTQTYHYGYNRPTVLTDPTGLCPIVCTAIIGGVAGGVVGGIDCWLSGDDRNTCIKKVAVGAAAGALTGATMGAAGSVGAGAYAGITGAGAGATQLAGTVIVGGAGSALYGSGVAAATGQDYTLRQAGGGYDYGRGVSPAWVEYVIRNVRGVRQDNGNYSHMLGTLQVIVSREGRVVTVITH
ncbi:RHS repeat domain-containing protein [Plantactinospora sp. WMMC1484]|uniref:RHS repeat domain-containing protein n=1 Tax=Plantactinospora sp. WMMC1484 TaxID=3404122 RepID=UPI003BF50556